MTDLNSLMIFAVVVEGNGFSEAARRLNVPVSTVSRRIAELEDQLGVRLLERSTRNMRVTEIGLEILEQAKRSAEISEALRDIVSNRLSKVCGVLRLSVPPNISDSLVIPLVTAFQASYPDVRVQVFVTERAVDHIAEGIDITFRITELKDSTLVARRLLRYRQQLVASPAYLRTHDAPRAPSDLKDHKILSFSGRTSPVSWDFVNRNGEHVEIVIPSPYIAMNDFSGLIAAALAGSGICNLPPIVQPQLLRDGLLLEVMPDWHFPTLDLCMVHLGTRNMTRVIRVFQEFAVQMAPALFPSLPT